MANSPRNSIYQTDTDVAPLLDLAEASIRKVMPLTRLSLRGRSQAQKAAGEALGFDLPQSPLTAAAGDGKAAFWLGPDEWLVLAAEADTETLITALSDKIGDNPHALVDISHRQDAIVITGAKAEWLLNSGIPIDLHEDAFPVGTITRTVFHKAPVMLWRTGPDTFVVEAWVSFMDYVSGLLCEAAGEMEAG
jgi:sarcosine oxidase subunit gamma